MDQDTCYVYHPSVLGSSGRIVLSLWNSDSLCKDCSPVHAMSEADDCPDYHLDNNSSVYQSEVLLKDLSYTPDPVSCGHTPDDLDGTPYLDAFTQFQKASLEEEN